MNMPFLPSRVAPAVLIGALASGGVLADDNIAAMRAELDTLKAQYEARIQSLEQRLNDAEQQLAQEQQQPPAAVALAAAPAPAPAVVAGGRGVAESIEFYPQHNGGDLADA